jgi:capsule polysaccharide export protein KpsE/RkpR
VLLPSELVVSPLQTGALQARLMSSESAVMSLQHQVQQKEADLLALRQEVSVVSKLRDATLSCSHVTSHHSNAIVLL